MEDKFGEVKGAITHKVDDLSPLFMQGMIPLFSVNVGDVVDIDTRTSPASTSCLIVKCQKGDTFTVTGTGGTQAMPWAFLDTEKRLLSKAGSNVSVENLTVIAPEDGYFISCSTNTADPPFAVSSNQYFRFKETQNTLDNITNGAHFDKNLTSLFVAGIIPLFDINVGDTVDTKTLVSFSTGSTLIVPCLKGDIFTITGTGGVQARPWAFLDSDKKLLSKAGGNTSVENLIVKADVNGYFISSGVNTSPFIVIANQFIDLEYIYNKVDGVSNEYGEPSYKLLTDPYLLNFRYGQISMSGAYTHNVTTLTLRDAIPVKAGDVITVESDCQLQVTHSVDGFKSFTDGNLKYTVANDGNIIIGIKYSDQRNLDNNKILDKLHLELHTVVDRLRGNNRNRVFFGRVPMSGWYLGKHTDTSGFGQNTLYSTALAKWDSLVDDEYITKEDLGVGEDGQHIWCYHLIPPQYKNTLNGKRHPCVVVTSGMHGHGKSGCYGLLYLIEDMMEHTMEDDILHYLRDNVEFCIIPMSNPWGWNAGTDHAGLRYNYRGVNLNRNFGSYNWADMTDESFTTPWQYDYKGEAPFSELETQHIRDVITRYSDCPISIDWHTLGRTGTTKYDSMTWFSHPYFIRNKYDDRQVNAAMTMLESTKSYFDSIYEVNGGLNQAYGAYALEPERPTINTWVFESTNTISTTLETTSGGADGFLGQKLTPYSPDVIKMSTEMFANYLITILRELAK